MPGLPCNHSVCLAQNGEVETILLRKPDNEKRERERNRQRESWQRKDASPLSFSRAGSLLAFALVDHGRKQVDAAAAAVLLWALVADRYILML